MQRPEVLTTASIPINIHPVPQTNGTPTPAANNIQGNLAAFGTTSGNVSFTKSFTEHCTIIGLACARADLTYQQGIPRMFSRRTRYDYYWPALSHLGEQEVLNQEIYADGTANDALVFGYQERYAEYRYHPSKITSIFRSTYATNIDEWHLSEQFTSLPALGATFIVQNTPVDRVIAVSTEPHLIFDSYFNLRCARPMPVYSVPGMIDHF